MTGLYWDYYDEGGVRLKSYGAITRGAKSVVKIELEVTDERELSDILRQCREMSKPQPKPKRITKQPLALPDFSGGGS